MDLTRRSLLQLLGVGSAALALRERADPVEAASVEDDDVRPRRRTRLDDFLRTRGIKPSHLAHEAGYSRQYLLRLRFGRLVPTRAAVAALTLALCRITSEHVTPADLFEPPALRATSRGER